MFNIVWPFYCGKSRHFNKKLHDQEFVFMQQKKKKNLYADFATDSSWSCRFMTLTDRKLLGLKVTIVWAVLQIKFCQNFTHASARLGEVETIILESIHWVSSQRSLYQDKGVGYLIPVILTVLNTMNMPINIGIKMPATFPFWHKLYIYRQIID